jgi:cytosine/adenosine deaminase-related metal-dependent hydrolase
MLLRTGTTTVGDIEMAPELLPDVWSATPLRVFSFLEMTGVKSRRPPREIVREALDKITSLPSGSRRVGLSPHSPYSTTPALLRLSAQAARRHRLRLAVHVAESEQEVEMFANASGKMYTWLARNGRDMSDCGLGSPVQHLERQGLLNRNLIAVHSNYLAPGDAALLAKRRVSVCHCPRSHAYFKHRAFPLAELATAGVNICIGTDSLASLHGPRNQLLELNLFDEMRELASAHPTLTPDTVLRMATVNGAIALGLKNRIGELSAKTLADVIAIPYSGKIHDSPVAIVQHRGNVSASMIDGKWAIAPNPKLVDAPTAFST